MARGYEEDVPLAAEVRDAIIKRLQDALDGVVRSKDSKPDALTRLRDSADWGWEAELFVCLEAAQYLAEIGKL